MNSLSNTPLSLPRAMQMELVDAFERGDQSTITRHLERNPEMGDAIITFMLGLQVMSAPEIDAPEIDAIVDRGIAQGMRRLTLSLAFESARLTKVRAARKLHLGADILQKLMEGRIQIESIPQRFFDQLAAVLETSLEHCRQCIEGSAIAPAQMAANRLGASLTPEERQEIPAQTFAEAVSRSPDMQDADRADWLQA